jgi:hypothetical protein
LIKWNFDGTANYLNDYSMEMPIKKITTWWNDELKKWLLDKMTNWWDGQLSKW